jgi:hypothetical protein
MADLTVQKIGPYSNLAATYASLTTGDKVPVDVGERTILHIKNSGTLATITIPKQTTVPQVDGVGGLTLNDIVFTVAATTGEAFSPPIPGSHVGVDGKATINFSGGTLTAAALRVEPLSRNL